MGMLKTSPPALPKAPEQYNRQYMNQLLNVFYLFFQNLNAVQPLNLSTINLDLNTLPTEADLADLRLGDIYRDTTADNAIKVKV